MTLSPLSTSAPPPAPPPPPFPSPPTQRQLTLCHPHPLLPLPSLRAHITNTTASNNDTPDTVVSLCAFDFNSPLLEIIFFFYLLLHQSVIHNLQLLALSLGPSNGRCLEQGKHRHPFAASITSLPRVINGSYYVTNLPFPNVDFRSLPRLAFSGAVLWMTLSSPGCESRRFLARCAGLCYSQSNWIPPRHRMKQFLCVFNLEWPSFVVPCLVVAKTDGPIWADIRTAGKCFDDLLLLLCAFFFDRSFAIIDQSK